jgi:hypothetical protein
LKATVGVLRYVGTGCWPTAKIKPELEQEDFDEKQKYFEEQSKDTVTITKRASADFGLISPRRSWMIS